MPVSTTSNPGKNFDPNSYDGPKDFDKLPDGRYYPTDYQTALTLRKFMHDNNMPFISQSQINDANKTGFV